MVHKTQVELSLLLPGVTDSRDACIGRLRDVLEAKAGIETAHLLEADASNPHRICVHFDPEQLSVGELREFAHRVGTELDTRYGHLLLDSRPKHSGRARALVARLERLDGVLEAAVSPDGLVRVEFDQDLIDRDAIVATVGDSARPLTDAVSHARAVHEHLHDDAEHVHVPAARPHLHAHEHAPGSLFGEYTELAFGALSGFCLAAGFLIGQLTNGLPWIAWSGYVASYFFGGYYTVQEAIDKIRSGKFEIDFLMLVAAAGAACLGEWAEGALLLFLFSIGHALEHYAMGRAKHAIESLATLAPAVATVRRSETWSEVPVELLRPGDLVLVRPNERIAADGFIVTGTSSVDQAPITGESVPANKRPVDDVSAASADSSQLAAEQRVFAGTINQSGALEVQVTRFASDTTLARVVQMVNEAETQKSPTQRLTDKFERVFVPTVLGLVVLLLFAWVVIDEPFSRSFYRAMAVLVAASPCALAISTPSAVLSGVARAARGGVLIKGGGPLENLGKLGALAFDKTGTLTEGKPRVTDVVSEPGVDQQKLLTVAAAAERLSDHPLAKAVVAEAGERLAEVEVPRAEDFQSITGKGIRATLDGGVVLIGKDALFAETDGRPIPERIRDIVARLEDNGRTTMIVRYDDRYLGVIGLMDTPRKSAPATIRRLRKSASPG